MSSIEILRNLHADPVDYAAALGPYVYKLGVDADIQREPNQYLEQVRAIDPRFLDESGLPRVNSLSRQELAARDGENSQIDPILAWHARLVGVMDGNYRFDDMHSQADAVLVTGGVMSAIRDRTQFAMGSDVDVPIYVSGSPRKHNDTEAEQLRALGLTPEDHPTESELAQLVLTTLQAESGSDERLRLFPANAKFNAAMIQKFLEEHPALRKLSVITTDHYVPFTAMDAGRAITELGRGAEARVYADLPDPEKQKARTNKIYLTEITRSLRGAANWVIARQNAAN